MSTAEPTRHMDELDLKELLKILIAVKKGDFSVRLPENYTGIAREIAATLNAIIESDQKRATELERLRFLVAQIPELKEEVRLLAQQNEEVEQARQLLEEKAQQLALSSQYKSEFVANMSHELRTPLNSLLILARLLAENLENNLTPKQIEYIQIIHSAGSDLLGLINDILDIAKIESGTMSVDLEQMPLIDLKNHLERTFRQMAHDKGLQFNIRFNERSPQTIFTDGQRLQQVLKNLISNAFKFTTQGQITLQVDPVSAGWSRDLETLNHADLVLAFAVSDTGIGIALDKQKLIFEAFQQADGSTSRQYGGTGLGLSISREIASLLGGEITLSSQVGVGSTFTLYLPQTYLADATHSTSGLMNASVEVDSSDVPLNNDDRETIQNGDRVMLIVEDDPNFAGLLLEIIREQGYKGLITTTSASALSLTQQFHPVAIFLNTELPSESGWSVLERIKHEARTSDIPVIVFSTTDHQKRAEQLGAIAFYQQPIQRDSLEKIFDDLKAWLAHPQQFKQIQHSDQLLQGKKVLIIDDDIRNIFALTSLLERYSMQVLSAENSNDGLALLDQHSDIDLIVMDVMMPGNDGYETTRLIRQMESYKSVAIIALTARAMKSDRHKCLASGASDYITKPVDTDQLLSLLRVWLS